MTSKRKILNSALFIIILGITTALLGMSFQTFMETYIETDSFFVEILKISGLVLIFFIAYLFHTIIHEAGHLIFGMMTGYSFISFRIGSFTITKEDGKIKLTRYNIPGTGGQCLMMPPDSKDGKYPFVIYNPGGVIMNLFFSIGGILIVNLIEGIIFPLDVLLVISSIAGISVALTNGIPMKIGGISNDADNILSILKDEEARNSFYLQLKVNGLQTQGTRIKDMPFEMFSLKEDADLSSPLNTAVGLMRYDWHLDNMDLEASKECIDSFNPCFSNIIPLYRNEINCEKIFLELVGDCDKEFIDKLYDKTLEKYIKAAKFMISKKRFLMAYEGFYNKDEDKALKYYEDLKQLAGKYPIKGEAEMELMIGDWMKGKL